MRRTPPIPKQVIPPFFQTNALLKARLIDFDTGHAELEEQHKTFLREAMGKAKHNSAFHVRIFGFASRLGDPKANHTLSLARMQSVLNFVKREDGRVLNSLQMFHPFGESRSGGGENDNAPEFRAVEVHIFIGEMPPDDPPGPKKIDPPQPPPPLPGGPRSGKWSVAAPGGATFTVGPSIVVLTAGITFGANFFKIRNDSTNEVRNYATIVLGLGASLGIPAGFTSIKNLLQTFLTGPNFSNMNFTPVFPRHAVTWEEVESCLVTVQGANAGVIRSKSIAVITFNCPGVWQFGQSGSPIKVAEDIWSFNSEGDNWQLGVGTSATTGPLVRL